MKFLQPCQCVGRTGWRDEEIVSEGSLLLKSRSLTIFQHNKEAQTVCFVGVFLFACFFCVFVLVVFVFHFVA